MLKKALLLFGTLSIAGSAVAADITNPFYLVSEQGEIGFIASADTRHIVEKNSEDYTKSHQFTSRGKIHFGLTDSLALIGSIGNTREAWKGKWASYGQDGYVPRFSVRDHENLNWSAGLGWNIFSGPARWQISTVYGQDRLKNFDGEYKYVAAETKLGYQFKRILPYITGDIEIPIGQKSGRKGVAGDKFSYSTKAGIYQGKCEVWTLDTGIRLSYNENREARIVAAEGEASFYLTPKTAISIYGSYVLDGKAKYNMEIDDDRSVGLKLRLFF